MCEKLQSVRLDLCLGSLYSSSVDLVVNMQVCVVIGKMLIHCLLLPLLSVSLCQSSVYAM